MIIMTTGKEYLFHELHAMWKLPTEAQTAEKIEALIKAHKMSVTDERHAYTVIYKYKFELAEGSTDYMPDGYVQ